jgi:hypothetical protein
LVLHVLQKGMLRLPDQPHSLAVAAAYHSVRFAKSLRANAGEHGSPAVLLRKVAVWAIAFRSLLIRLAIDGVIGC